jgi:hypothetical protein
MMQGRVGLAMDAGIVRPAALMRGNTDRYVNAAPTSGIP